MLNIDDNVVILDDEEILESVSEKIDEIISDTNNDDVDYDVSIINDWSAGCLVSSNAFEFYNDFMSKLTKLN